MRSKRLAQLIVITIALVLTGSAMALSLNSTHYTTYEGTGLFGDRFLYLVPKEATLIIHGDIATPIRFMPNTPAYMMRINPDGTLSELVANNDLNVKNIVDVCNYFGISCVPSSLSLFSGDFDGDNQSDFAFLYNGKIHIIKDANGGSPAFYTTLTPPSGAQIASISDRNGDGRADIVLSGSAGLLASAGNGQFRAESVPLFTNTSLVGAIAGSFRVNEQGAATYNIPIMTFAGSAGVAPQVSLNYNSQNGSGIAGVGWSISGLSAISRCRQTEAQDNNALPLTFGPGDRFCLDGQRLILSSGSTYGAPETKYRTEIDSGVEVTAKGGSTGNPGYFEVTRKDGSISEYGSGGNAKQLAGSSTLTWSINQFADSAGNPIKFQYLNDANGLRISRINYAFGSNKSAQTSDTHVAFTYTNRPDPQISYVNATKLSQAQRLTKVETFNNGTSLRSYNLQYKTALPEHGSTNQFAAANKSYLEALYECIGSQCLKPTKFHWLAKAGSNINWSQKQDLVFEDQQNQVANWKPLDFNGDGIMDLAAVVTDYKKRDGHIHDTWVYVYQGQPGGGYSRHTAYYKHWNNSDNKMPFKIEVLDYNADSRQDIALWDHSSWKILLSKPAASGWAIGSGNTSYDVDTGIALQTATFVDIDSDGMPDVVTNGLSFRRMMRDSGQASHSPKAYRFGDLMAPSGLPPIGYGGILGDCHTVGAYCEVIVTGGAQVPLTEWRAVPAADINGDGRLDILANSPTESVTNAFYAYSINSNNSVSTVTGPQPYSWSQDNDPYVGGFKIFGYVGVPQVFGDINADGAVDWLYLGGTSGNNRIWRYVIQGKHWGSASDALVTTHKDATPQLIDYNRDGFLDVVWHHVAGTGSALKVKLWNPSAEMFGAESVIISTNGSTETQHLFLDINGDGALDYVTGTDGKLTIYSGHLLGIDSVISHIDNGMGNQTDISYEQLSNRSAHYEGMEKRVTRNATTQESCYYDGYFGTTICAPVTMTSVQAEDFYRALNSDWNFDLADVYNGSGLNPLYIAKDPSAPVLEFSAPVQIVTRVGSSAPTGSNVNSKSYIRYHYGEAKIQAKGRGLLGFRTIRTVDEQSNVNTTTRYRQDFPFIGSPLLTEVRTNDGKLVKRSLNDYGHLPATGTDNTKRYQVWARNVLETTYDLNGAETSHVVATTAQPDEWGNVGATTVSTYSAGNHSSYLTQVATSNSYNGGVNGIRYGRLSNSTVTHRRAGEPAITKSSSFTYYTSGVATNLLQTETIDAGSDGTPAVTTTYTYDNFGNKTKAVVATAGQASRQTDWAYSFDGRYLESTTNGLGHVTEQVTLRNEYGSPTRIEGLNGYWSEIEYDSQGRETYRRDASGAWQRTAYSMSDLSAVPGARYRVTTEVAGGGTSTDYFDLLGRSIAHSTVGFEGMTHWTETQYDSSGRVQKQSEPYRAGGLTYWSVNEYDVLGRIKKQTLPGNNGHNTITYNGLETIYTNPLNQQRIERRNAAGELIEVQDALNGRIVNAYTTTGQLKSAAVTAEGKTITTQMSYDSRGQKIRMFDPDKGSWYYEYNGFGELVNQYKVTSAVEFTDTLANLKSDNSRYQRTHMVYDKLGRMTQRSDYKQGNVLEGTATWTYDTASNGVGRLAAESGGGLTKSYYYGAYTGAAGRTDIVALDGGVAAQMSTTYDAIGRPWKQIDALHLNSGTENIYNGYGYLDTVRDLETGATVYNAEAVDARGNITRAILLGGETVERVYDAATGRLQVIKGSTLAGNGDIQHLNYSWDTVGNMTSRNDLKYAQQQSFCYDALNRLIKSHSMLNGSCSLSAAQQDQEYDGFGNITRKTGVGNYTYSTNMKLRPHAVTNAGGVVYNYDNNGNVINDGTGRTFTYATYDLPTKIVKGTQQVEFSYGADRSRWKRVDNDNGTLTTTWYLGNIEKVQQGSTVKYKRTVAGVAIFNYDGNLAPLERLTMFTDALGSVVATRNATSGALNGMAFNPWGERVMASNYGDIVDGTQLTPFLSVLNVPTTRGFTGHEMVDSMGLIHMNGRIYDARLGRFLQADIQVDGVLSTQGYNRYSYGQNNPLSGTDPSGYGFLKEVFDDFLGLDHINPQLAQVVVAVASIYCNAGYAACVAAGNAAIAAGNGADFGDALKAGVVAGVSAYAFQTVAQGYAGAEWATNGGTIHIGNGALLNGGGFAALTVTQGMVGGVMAELQGGKFGHGFASAGFSKLASPFLPATQFGFKGIDMGQVVAAALIGGTASKISGGKFANGAVTAAFVNLFNQQRAAYTKEQIDRANACLKAGYCGADENSHMKTTLIEFEDLTTTPLRVFLPFFRTMETVYDWAKAGYDYYSGDTAGAIAGVADVVTGRLGSGAFKSDAIGEIYSKSLSPIVEEETRAQYEKWKQ